MLEIKLLADCQQHIPYLAQLWYEEISKHWVPNASIERATQNLVKHANHEILPITLVAIENGQPIGMASLRANDGIQPEHTPWLGSLVVSPQHRHRKIGEQLIEAITQEALARGYHRLYLLAFDPTIPQWYAKLGWRGIGEDQLFGHTVTVMEIGIFHD